MIKLKNLFSERKSITKIEDKLQSSILSNESINIIWSAIAEVLLAQVYKTERSHFDKNLYFYTEYENIWAKTFFDYFWLRIIKKPIDELNDNWIQFYNLIRKYYFSLNWGNLYNFLEIIFKTVENKTILDTLRIKLNYIFTQENIPYRIINDTVTDIIDPIEISEVNEALKTISSGIEEHLSRAIELLYSKDKPDYRNSIKESISAVESLCKKIVKSESATLSEALKIIKNKHKIHPSLEAGLHKIYGYSSDEKGIRHALLDESSIDYPEAKFMLVSCSSFINYLRLLTI